MRTPSLATPEGRRRATQHITSRCEHIPPELVAHLIRGAAACHGGGRADRPRAARGLASTPSG